VTRSPHRLEPVSATFHGRDIFAPVGAHLAAGAELADAGDPLNPEELERVELPQPREEDGAVVAHALAIDRFGNVKLNIDHEWLAGRGLTLGGQVDVAGHAATYTHTFADVGAGELLVYQDAYRRLALAINRGDAAGALGLEVDAEVRLRPR
jgi:S-adenosylmethionine hydrolase